MQVECEIWWSKPLPAEENHLDLLDNRERERFSSYRKEIDGRRFLTGRVIAKTIAGQRLGRKPRFIELDASCPDCEKHHGPPRISGSSLRLSISHSGDRIGVAFTDSVAVGLDVEAVRPVEDSLVSYALTKQELSSFASLNPEFRSTAFFTYWTRKESLMKATERGLRIPLSTLTVSPPYELARLVDSGDPALKPETTQLVDLNPGDGYQAAVALLCKDNLLVTENWWEA